MTTDTTVYWERRIGPPTRLYRYATSARGNWFIQTYNRFSGEWKLAGRERQRNIANTLVRVGVAAWCEPRPEYDR